MTKSNSQSNSCKAPSGVPKQSMDSSILSKLEDGDATAIRQLAGSIPTLDTLTLCRTVKALDKGFKKQQRSENFDDHAHHFTVALAALIACISERCEAPEAADFVALAVTFITDAIFYPEYLQISDKEHTPLYAMLGKLLVPAQKTKVIDSALRVLYVLPDSDKLFKEHAKESRLCASVLHLIGTLARVAVEDGERAQLIQVALDAMAFAFDPAIVDPRELCSVLMLVYDNGEGVWGESLIRCMAQSLPFHPSLRSSGLFAVFVERASEDPEYTPSLREVINVITVDIGAGSCLYAEAMDAMVLGGGFAEEVKALLARGLVREGLTDLVRMLEASPSAASVAQRAGLKSAVEAAVCHLVLDPSVPVLEKDIKVMARAALKQL